MPTYLRALLNPDGEERVPRGPLHYMMGLSPASMLFGQTPNVDAIREKVGAAMRKQLSKNIDDLIGGFAGIIKCGGMYSRRAGTAAQGKPRDKR
jgi:hypothetical protein